MGAYGLVDKALDSRSEGLGFHSQCWPCVEVSGKVCIPHHIGLPSHNGYLVHRSNIESIVACCIGAHLDRGKVESAEQALSWSLDSKQLPLPLPFTILVCIFVLHPSQKTNNVYRNLICIIQMHLLFTQLPVDYITHRYKDPILPKFPSSFLPPPSSNGNMRG